MFCPRHRRALDGAILGLLQFELRVARSRSRGRRGARKRAAAIALKGGAAGANGAARKVNTVVCTQCGMVWQKEAYIRQQQNLEAEESFARPPKSLGKKIAEKNSENEGSMPQSRSSSPSG
ncbi:MAG TPA: hypothetical protein VJR23_05260 [Candidatus Acidoferrales bacterium]|nr:hypothetical protein [Candidatus Acidoferrales bacterium]